MRHETQQVLSAYLIGKASLDLVRRFIEDVDWDAPDIPEDERTILLKSEAYLAGIDEAFSDESELRHFLAQSIQVMWRISESSAVISSGSTNVSLGIQEYLTPIGAAQ